MSKTEGRSSGKIVELRQQNRDDTGKAVTDFVRDHPLLVVAGGIALGAVAAAMLPRGTGRKLARRAISLAELAGTAGALLGTRARETAEAAGAGLRDQGGVMADRLEKLGGSASEKFGKLGGAAGARIEKLKDPVESAAAKVVQKASELRGRVRH